MIRLMPVFSFIRFLHTNPMLKTKLHNRLTKQLSLSLVMSFFFLFTTTPSSASPYTSSDPFVLVSASIANTAIDLSDYSGDSELSNVTNIPVSISRLNAEIGGTSMIVSGQCDTCSTIIKKFALGTDISQSNFDGGQEYTKGQIANGDIIIAEVIGSGHGGVIFTNFYKFTASVPDPTFGDHLTDIFPISQGGPGCMTTTYFSKNGRTAYILGCQATVTVIDTSTHEILRNLSLFSAESPDGSAFASVYLSEGFALTSDERFFYLSNSNGNNVFKVDTTTGEVLQTIDLSAAYPDIQNPETCPSDWTKCIYLNKIILTNNDRYLWVQPVTQSSLLKVDLSDNNSISKIDLNYIPATMALSGDGLNIYTVGIYTTRVDKVNILTGQVSTLTPDGVSGTCDTAGCGLTITHGKIWVSTRTGIFVYEETSGDVVATINNYNQSAGVSLNPGYMTSSPDGSRIFLADANAQGVVYVIDGGSYAVLDPIVTSFAGGAATLFVAVPPDGTTLWTTYGNTSQVVTVSFLSPPQASKLGISKNLVGGAHGVAFTTQPEISIQDSANHVVTTSSLEVTATVNSGGRLIGTTKVAASSGVVTFANLGLEGNVGSTYTITFSADGLTSATSNVTLTSSPIGETGPGGGKVFYYSKAGFACGQALTDTCNFLEAAPSDWNNGNQGPTSKWSADTTTHVDTTSADIGSGLYNAGLITSQSSADVSAVTIARAYRGGGKTDWYLPSRFELNEFSNQQSIIGSLSGDYWSSTEMGGAMAWYQYFPSDGYNGGYRDKADLLHIRPIRAFGTSPVSPQALIGVTLPVTGATPVTTVTSGNGLSGSVSWSGSPSTFLSSTTYTATITLRATAGYTLTGVGPNSFTVAGATSVTNSADSGVVTAVFPATNYVALLAPAFSLSRNAETATVGTAITGYSISSTGGLVSTYSISPSVGNGLSFSSTTGLVTGSPSSVASAVTYTITGTNATSSSTATYTITVNPSPVTISAGSAPNSQVATIPSGVTTASIPATSLLPATTINFGGTVPTAVTLVPVTSNPASASATPFTISGSLKIVDIQISGSITGSVTVCLDGAPTDHLYHFTGGAWVELPSRTYVGGQVCGVTSSFSPFVSAPPAPALIAVPVPVPDPVQQSKISGISLTSSTLGTPTPIVITGSFIEKIRAIQINGVSLPLDSWSQTQSTVTFTMPNRPAGTYQIQLFNGSAPVMAAQNFTYIAPKTVEVVLPPIAPKQKVTYIRCSKPGHGTRIAYGVNPVCPSGYVKK